MQLIELRNSLIKVGASDEQADLAVSEFALTFTLLESNKKVLKKLEKLEDNINKKLEDNLKKELDLKLDSKLKVLLYQTQINEYTHRNIALNYGCKYNHIIHEKSYMIMYGLRTITNCL
ncbi:hypothetical protein Vafri_5168 [Volvox africanus]|uniref:Uncharacterized protein n=1 Tax=Volvox africanus TaxID=51714 RepID=A0A8J4EVR3_9CHLO|nr:hypothetical protein Vafri_5168 [Volvox africanus]